MDRRINSGNKCVVQKLRMCLNIAYFAKIENLLLKVLSIKVKISWNSTMGPWIVSKSAVDPWIVPKNA